jgi:hypothetical protein
VKVRRKAINRDVERERDARLKAKKGGEESTKEENKKNTYRVVKNHL